MLHIVFQGNKIYNSVDDFQVNKLESTKIVWRERRKMKTLFKNDKAFRWFCIALILILLSGIVCSLTETSGYSVKVKDYKLRWEEMAAQTRENAEKYGKDVVVTYDGSNGSVNMTTSTKQLCFKLLIPKNASAENPVPAIVTNHGFYNNKEMQDSYYVELARRGYAVIALDMAGHGSSDVTFDPSANIITATDNCGMEAAVEWLMSQPYVDETKIGITGHSQGGRACGWTMQHLIRAGHADYVKAYLGQSNSAGLTAILDEFGEFPETLVTGTIMCRYDEFSIVRDNSYDYLNSDQARLLTGKVYSGIKDTDVIEEGAFYTADGIASFDISKGETVGKQANVIYWPWIIHPWEHFSMPCSAMGTTFFYSTLGIPSGAKFINPSNQIWEIKEIFNLVGLIGFFLLIVPLVTLLLRLPVFAPLAKGTSEIDERLPAFKGAKVQIPFWLSGLIMTTLCAAIFQKMYSGYRWGNNLFPVTAQYPQTTSNTIGMWTAACGIICLIVVLVFWFVRWLMNRKDENYYDNPFAVAKLDSVGEFLRTILLTAVTIIALYAVVWLQYIIWGTDFRIWYLAVLPFEFTKVGVVLRYVPFWFVFYVINAMCNANNRFKDMAEWKTIALSSLFSILGLAVIVIIEYVTMKTQGTQAVWMAENRSIMGGVSMALGYILLIGIMPVIVVANIISRKIFLKTGNIWLGGLITGCLAAIMWCVNTFTQFAYTLAT